MAPIVGFDAVMKPETLAAFFRKNGSSPVRTGFINGLPGFGSLEALGLTRCARPVKERGRHDLRLRSPMPRHSCLRKPIAGAMELPDFLA